LAIALFWSFEVKRCSLPSNTTVATQSPSEARWKMEHSPCMRTLGRRGRGLSDGPLKVSACTTDDVPSPDRCSGLGRLVWLLHCTANCTDYHQSGPVLSGSERSPQTRKEGCERGLVTLSRWRSGVRSRTGHPIPNSETTRPVVFCQI